MHGDGICHALGHHRSHPLLELAPSWKFVVPRARTLLT